MEKGKPYRLNYIKTSADQQAQRNHYKMNTAESYVWEIILDVIKDFFIETYFDRYDEVMSDSLLTMLWAMTVALFCVGGHDRRSFCCIFLGKFGRKGTLLLNNAVAFTCAALQGCSKVSKSFEVLIVGRVVAGICCGLKSAVAPLYLVKIAPISLRGFCVTCNQLSITFGVLIRGILGMILVLDTETLWPILVASPTIPAIYSLVTLTFCPESPKYLLVNKRDDDAAEAALIWFRKTSNVSEEMEAMKKEGQDLRNSPKCSIFWHHCCCLLLYKYFYLSWSEQGDFSVCYSGHRCCKSHDDLHICPDQGLGRQKNSAHDWPCGYVYLLSSTSCLPFTTENIALAIISIVTVIIYTCLFATGPGSIPWFMMTEMFAQGPRSAAVSVFVVINWLCNFAVGLGFPILQKSLETYSFLPFSVMLLLFFIFTYMFVPETKGKSISEITQLFKSSTMDRSESRNSYKSSKN
ncbi:solute carrier family 2, facilitated glucose transporter member 1 [Biomphalaria glabrata]|nr:solute carrier family 2, facilitated glucose transporter member 1 [Biomphalaria glabrata]